MKGVLITTSSFGKYDPRPLKLINENGWRSTHNPFGRKLTEEELIDLVRQCRPNYIIAGTERMGCLALDAMKPFVKIISRCGVGMDGIDLEYAKKIGIKVTNTPDAPTAAVAELTLGVILDLLRRISRADKGVRRGEFTKQMGTLLSCKTVGIIGCGRIGSHLAAILRKMGCRVIGSDPIVQRHPEIEMKSFDDVIREADIVTLHIPFTEENYHLIDEGVLQRMKPTSYLINAARGGLVDEGALYAALTEGRIAGAALDCYETEPYSGKLAELDNVVLTPHIGSYAREARIKQEMDAVNNILKNLQYV